MQAFEELFHQYFERIYRFALSLTRNSDAAEELTQQTFFKALKNLDRFEGRCDPSTWLCSIAKNEYFNQKRRKREQSAAPGSRLFHNGADSVENLFMEKDQVMRIHQLLHALDEPYREVFSLKVFSDLKYSQIASLFSKSESWARVTFYRAKCELQNKIKEADENDK